MGVWSLVVVLYIITNVILVVEIYKLVLNLSGKVVEVSVIGDYIDPRGLRIGIIILFVAVYATLVLKISSRKRKKIESYVRRKQLHNKMTESLRDEKPETLYGGISKGGKTSFVENELALDTYEGKETILIDFEKVGDPLELLRSLKILPYENFVYTLKAIENWTDFISLFASLTNWTTALLIALRHTLRYWIFNFLLFPKIKGNVFDYIFDPIKMFIKYIFKIPDDKGGDDSKKGKRQLRSEVVQELAKRFSNVGLIVVDHAVEGKIGEGYRAVLKVAENAGIKVAYVLKEGKSSGIDVLHYNFNLYEMLQYIGAYLKEKDRYIKLDSGLYRLYVSNEEVPGGQDVRLMDVRVVYKEEGNDNIDLGIISVLEEDSVSSDPFGVRFSYPALNPVKTYSSKFFDFLRFIINLQVLVDGHPVLLERVLDRVSVEGVRSDGLEKIVKEERRDLGLSLNPNDIDNEYLLVASYYRMIMLRYYIKSIEGSEAFI